MDGGSIMILDPKSNIMDDNYINFDEEAYDPYLGRSYSPKYSGAEAFAMSALAGFKDSYTANFMNTLKNKVNDFVDKRNKREVYSVEEMKENFGFNANKPLSKRVADSIFMGKQQREFVESELKAYTDSGGSKVIPFLGLHSWMVMDTIPLVIGANLAALGTARSAYLSKNLGFKTAGTLGGASFDFLEGAFGSFLDQKMKVFRGEQKEIDPSKVILTSLLAGSLGTLFGYNLKGRKKGDEGFEPEIHAASREKIKREKQVKMRFESEPPNIPLPKKLSDKAQALSDIEKRLGVQKFKNIDEEVESLNEDWNKFIDKYYDEPEDADLLSTYLLNDFFEKGGRKKDFRKVIKEKLLEFRKERGFKESLELDAWNKRFNKKELKGIDFKKGDDIDDDELDRFIEWFRGTDESVEFDNTFDENIKGQIWDKAYAKWKKLDEEYGDPALRDKERRAEEDETFFQWYRVTGRKKKEMEATGEEKEKIWNEAREEWKKILKDEERTQKIEKILGKVDWEKEGLDWVDESTDRFSMNFKANPRFSGVVTETGEVIEDSVEGLVGDTQKYVRESLDPEPYGRGVISKEQWVDYFKADRSDQEAFKNFKAFDIEMQLAGDERKTFRFKNIPFKKYAKLFETTMNQALGLEEPSKRSSKLSRIWDTKKSVSKRMEYMKKVFESAGIKSHFFNSDEELKNLQ